MVLCPPWLKFQPKAHIPALRLKHPALGLKSLTGGSNHSPKAQTPAPRLLKFQPRSQDPSLQAQFPATRQCGGPKGPTTYAWARGVSWGILKSKGLIFTTRLRFGPWMGFEARILASRLGVEPGVRIFSFRLGFGPRGSDFGLGEGLWPPGRDFDLKVRIGASGLGFRPHDLNFGFEIEVWAWRLGIGSWDWNWASMLGFGPGGWDLSWRDVGRGEGEGGGEISQCVKA